MLTPSIPGTPASGSFRVSGSTVNGRFASGSFRLNRQIEAATPAHFSFNVSGSHFAGTRASGSFSFARSTTPAVSASIVFTAKGRTIDQVESSGSFTVTGSRIDDAHATASFDVSGLPIGGERSYAIFDVGYENVHDGHTFSLGRGSSTWAVEVDIYGGAAVGNQSVSPFNIQKAATIEASTTNHYSGAIDTNSVTASTMEFYIFVGPDTTFTGGSGDKYIYESRGNFGSSKFSDPATVFELFVPQGPARQPVVRQYVQNSSATHGYYERTGSALANGWNRILIFSMIEGQELEIYVNGNGPVGSLNGFNADADFGDTTGAYSIDHKIMGNGTNTWGQDVKISNFIYWNTRPIPANDAVTSIGGTQYVTASTEYSSSNIRALYKFGDGSGDSVKYVREESARTLYLTASWNASSDSFADSNFVYRKTPTEYFNDVRTAINTNSNSSY